MKAPSSATTAGAIKRAGSACNLASVILTDDQNTSASELISDTDVFSHTDSHQSITGGVFPRRSGSTSSNSSHQRSSSSESKFHNMLSVASVGGSIKRSGSANNLESMTQSSNYFCNTYHDDTNIKSQNNSKTMRKRDRIASSFRSKRSNKTSEIISSLNNSGVMSLVDEGKNLTTVDSSSTSNLASQINDHSSRISLSAASNFFSRPSIKRSSSSSRYNNRSLNNFDADEKVLNKNSFVRSSPLRSKLTRKGRTATSFSSRPVCSTEEGSVDSSLLAVPPLSTSPSLSSRSLPPSPQHSPPVSRKVTNC